MWKKRKENTKYRKENYRRHPIQLLQNATYKSRNLNIEVKKNTLNAKNNKYKVEKIQNRDYAISKYKHKNMNVTTASPVSPLQSSNVLVWSYVSFRGPTSKRTVHKIKYILDRWRLLYS